MVQDSHDQDPTQLHNPHVIGQSLAQQTTTQLGSVMSSAPACSCTCSPPQGYTYLNKVVACGRRWRLCGEAKLLCLASLHSTCNDEAQVQTPLICVEWHQHRVSSPCSSESCRHHCLRRVSNKQPPNVSSLRSTVRTRLSDPHRASHSRAAPLCSLSPEQQGSSPLHDCRLRAHSQPAADCLSVMITSWRVADDAMMAQTSGAQASPTGKHGRGRCIATVVQTPHR